MAADLAVVNLDSMPGELAVLRFDGDVLVVLVEHDDGVQTREREIDRVHPDPGGFYRADMPIPVTRRDVDQGLDRGR